MDGIDLLKFCGGNDFRPYLKAPMRRGDFTYATDGAILIRVAAREGDASPPVSVNLEGPLSRGEDIVYSKPVGLTLPVRPAGADGACAWCRGSGTRHDCPDCMCTCEVCKGNGSGDRERTTSTMLSGAIFALNYVRLMLELPGVEIVRGSADSGSKLARPLLFRFDGGIGALMPLRECLHDHIEIEPVAATPKGK